MNKKEKAYELYNSGFSYGEISNELFISKSTAHGYVKELKLNPFKKP
jgi:orotate phosphoribosyltransferase-like protein